LVYEALGELNKAQTDFKTSAEQFRKSVELLSDPEDQAEAYNGRGCAYLDEDRYEQSIDFFTQAVEIDPDYDYAYNNRGFAYSRLGEYDLAFQDFEQAIKLNPDNAWIYYYRGLTYIDLGENSKAIADLELSLTLDIPPLDEGKRKDAEARLQELRGD
jgi:tetratricopeptide (TPR) repeat protein